MSPNPTIGPESPVQDHPIEILRRHLASHFSTDLPPGVHPIPAWCADPQFFPGATGLLDAEAWEAVVPGSSGALSELLPFPQGGVMVVGNYQATRASYKRVLDGEIGGFPTTWRVLRRLMASVPPRETFLTNAFIGLPDLARDTDPFPITSEFTRRCQDLLALEIELVQPRAVVCLGRKAADMMAAVATGLEVWRRWPGYGRLKEDGHRILEAKVGELGFQAVAVQHPSAVISREERGNDANLITRACSNP